MKVQKKIHFEISERKIMLRVLDVALVLLAFRLIGDFFSLEYLYSITTNFNNAAVFALYIYGVGTIFEMYNLQVASNQFQVVRSTLVTATTAVFLYLFTPIFTPVMPENRIQILFFYGITVVVLLSWRLFYALFLASQRFVQNVILVCDKEFLNELIKGLETADPHYKIIAFVNTDNSNTADEFGDYVRNIKREELALFVQENPVFEIVVASQKTKHISVKLYQELLLLLEAGNTIREYNQVYEDKAQRIPVQYITRDFYRFFPFSRSNSNQIYLLTVRALEIGIAIFGILVGLILIPFVFVANLIGNRGSLFYSQERVGKNGILFKIFKFRSMIHNAESNGAVFSSPNDNRITSFGRFLRKSRIDEFPQFFNILIGDMAVIGPRPERPFFVKEISEIMPFYETRHVVKPGLTGWAQVNFSYGESIEDSLVKLQYDLYYIKHRSVFLDINICFKTLTTVLFYRGQ